MRAPATLAKLLAQLRAAGVRSYRNGELRIDMGTAPAPPAAPAGQPARGRQVQTREAPRPDAVEAALNPPNYDPNDVEKA